jgi:hypothetical protein
MAGAIVLMAAAAFGFAGTVEAGHFTDAGAVATGLSAHAGHTVGVLFAVVLLDASLIGANAVGLATTYTLGDTFNKRHSLHWKLREAPMFYACYAALLTVSAAVAFSPDNVLGLLTQGVQALAGVLLPSATVFLVLLCNDRPVLGPWVNSVRQNIVAGIIVWSLVLLSLALTAATFFPHMSTATLKIGFALGTGVGVLGGIGTQISRRRAARGAAEREAEMLGDLDPDPDHIDEFDSLPSTLTRAERRAITDQDRASWRTPALHTLQRPALSPLRKAGLLTLRGYLLVAVALAVVKIVQTVG